MNHLEFYLDLKNDFLCLYDPDVEFFGIYYKNKNAWTRSKISFSQFFHDYDSKEISYEDAMLYCDNNFPNELYYGYLEMLFENGGIIKQREISIVRKSNTEYKNEKVYLYIDGVKYQSIDDNEKVSFMLDFKDHLITCKTDISNIKIYELHIPYGIDDYCLTMLFQNNELLII